MYIAYNYDTVSYLNGYMFVSLFHNQAMEPSFCLFIDRNFLLAEHLYPNHFCSITDPATCFQCCSRCLHIPPPPPPLASNNESKENTPSNQLITHSHKHTPNLVTDSKSRQTTDELKDVVPPNNNSPIDSDNILHFINPSKSLFANMFPYNQFRPQPHTWLEFVIVFFLVYQMTASTFITICEDEGPYRVFRKVGTLDIMELFRRICLYFLRILVRVATPFTFYRQICRMAEGERRYQDLKQNGTNNPTKKNRLQSQHHLPQDHHHFVQEVTLWSSIVPHAVMFSLILLSLGVFLTAEDLLIGDTICIRELFQIQVPFIGMQIFQLGDCLSVFFMMMVMGILKDCYCLENHLAEYNYDIMRERWFLIDTFCYVTSFLLFSFTMLMFIFGNPLTPPPSCDLDAGGLQLWTFWIIALTLLQFCGSSANRILKKSCVTGHIVLFIFILLLTFVLKVKKVTVPPGSAILLLYTTLAVTVFNLLLCLTLSHYRSKGCKSKRFYLSVLCLVILSVSVLATAICEVTYFALHNQSNCKSTQYCDASQNVFNCHAHF